MKKESKDEEEEFDDDDDGVAGKFNSTHLTTASRICSSGKLIFFDLNIRIKIFDWKLTPRIDGGLVSFTTIKIILPIIGLATIL